MKVTREDIERRQVVLNVEVEPHEMDEAVKKAYRRMGAQASIPGFRKGKVPPAILEQYIGREAIVEDAAEHLLPEVYEQAVEEQDIDPVARPQVEIVQVEPLSFKATVPVRPTVELGDYDEIRLNPEPVEVTDEEVGEVLERLRQAQAPWEPVEGPAQLDDMLTVSVQGTVDGEVAIDEEDGVYHMSAETPGALPGFAEQLVGVEKGEERSFTLTIPEGRGELGGKDCDFRVQVKEVKRKRLPELDDEFAKSLGRGFETLEALKEELSKGIGGKKEQAARQELEERAISALVDIATVEYPEVIVEGELERLVEENKKGYSDQEGLERYLDSVGKTEDEFRAELRPLAERIVVRSLVVQEFAAREGIKVDADEISAEIEQMSQYGSDDSLRQLFSTPQARVSLGRNLYMKKAMDRLHEIVTGGAESAAETAEAPSTKEEEVEKDAESE